MSILRKGTFEPPKRASASHLIHLIGIEQFREELAKQQKAKASGILEVITATSISRAAPPTKREQQMLNVASQMHQDGQINDLAWAQIKAIFVYIGATKDNKDCLQQDTLNFPEDWDPSQDLSFAKRLLPKFLSYQLENYKELGQSIDQILEKAGLLKQPAKEESLTPEQRQAAEETADWERIKDSNNKSYFQNHLNKYKNGAYGRLAYRKLEEIVWSEIGAFPSYNALLTFLDSFPHGHRAEEARTKLKELAEKIQKQHYENKKAKTARQKSKKQPSESSAKKESSAKEFLLSLFRSTAPQNAVTSAETSLTTIIKNTKDKPEPSRAKRSILLSMVAGVAFAIVALAILTKSNQYVDNSIRTFVGHSKSLKTAAFLPDSQFILSGSADRTLKLWNVNTGKEIRTFSGHNDVVSSVAISPEGYTALSGSHDKTMKLWDIRTGQLLYTFTGHKNSVVSVAFSKDGHLALSGSHDNTLKLWHISSGKLLKTFTGHKDWVIAVSFIEGTNAVLSASHDKTLKLWDMGTGRNVRTFVGHKDWITSISTARNDLVALSGSHDKTLKLWNMKTGETIRTFKNLSKAAVTSVTFSPDENTALASSFDNSLVFWNVKNGKKLKTFYGHQSSRVNAVTISPDGNLAISAGEDNTLKLWRLKKSKS